MIVPGRKLDCVCGPGNARIERVKWRSGWQERVVCTECVRRSKWVFAGPNDEHRGGMVGEWNEWVGKEAHEAHEGHEQEQE